MYIQKYSYNWKIKTLFMCENWEESFLSLSSNFCDLDKAFDVCLEMDAQLIEYFNFAVVSPLRITLTYELRFLYVYNANFK